MTGPGRRRLDGITLKTTLAENLPVIRADAGLLRSVIINLIDNAAEALENSPVRIIHVSTRADSDAESVEICVADTGHGISPQDKDKLFLPQFSTRERGTGLGLAIAARIVAEHGGSLRVEDNSPVGSRFLLQLPVADLVAAPDKPNPISAQGAFFLICPANALSFSCRGAAWCALLCPCLSSKQAIFGLTGSLFGRLHVAILFLPL
jgi:anti-sigma regulatory factor (Ser/Thr protein kinase)